MAQSALDHRMPVIDSSAEQEAFLQDVLNGLRATPRTLPCKYFYDAAGSSLFENICTLSEYYLTRAELEIMRHFSQEIAACLGQAVLLIEFGSGSGQKTKLLLNALQDPVAYVPIDISKAALKFTLESVRRAHPALRVTPVCGDFTTQVEIPRPDRYPDRTVVYFPGSTIGNFGTEDARRLLSRIATLVGERGGLLIGIDLHKDNATLEAAYNDTQGVTAEFNRNVLVRINRELNADFNVAHFQHRAIYVEGPQRIEMYLVSTRAQRVAIGGVHFEFASGEAICTEHSHKYAVGGFAELAAQVGLRLVAHWTDAQQQFGVIYFTTDENAASCNV